MTRDYLAMVATAPNEVGLFRRAAEITQMSSNDVVLDLPMGRRCPPCAGPESALLHRSKTI